MKRAYLLQISKTLSGLILCFCGLFFIAISANAHVRWDPNGATPPRDEGFASCDVTPADPTFLVSGSTVTVSWEVAITHGQAMRIDLFYDNGASVFLVADDIPESSGYSSMAINLPDIECDQCWLRIFGGGYESCADVQLTENGMPPADPMDTQAPDNVTELSETRVADRQVVLSWNNPPADFAGVLVLQASGPPDTAPMSGTAYELGDQPGNAEVVFKGSGEMATVTGLERNTTYFFKVHSYDANLNYADGNELMVTTSDVGNSQPGVSLNVLQGTALTTEITTDGGLVIVQAVVNDPDTEDTHVLDWSQTDMALNDVDLIEDTFSIDPAMLAAGRYMIQIAVTDSGTPQFSAMAEVEINVSAPAPEPDPTPSQPMTNNSSGGGGALSFPLLLLMCFGFVFNIFRFHKHRYSKTGAYKAGM